MPSRARRTKDYIRFQLEQLEEVHLAEGEQEELEQESETLSHAEEIKAGLYRIGQAFSADEGGLLPVLKESAAMLSSLQKVYQPATELAGRMHSTYIELKDIIDEISTQSEDIEFNPMRLDEVNGRLNLIYSLEQKHRVQTVEELVRLTEEYRDRLATITSFDDRIAALAARRDTQYNKVKKQAALLTKAQYCCLPVRWKNRWLPGWCRWGCQCAFSGGDGVTQGTRNAGGRYSEFPFLGQ